MSHDRSYLKSIYPIIKGDERFKNLLENDVNFFGLERMVAGVVEFDQTLPFLYEILNPYPNFNPYVRRQPKNIGELSKLFFELISHSNLPGISCCCSFFFGTIISTASFACSSSIGNCAPVGSDGEYA